MNNSKSNSDCGCGDCGPARVMVVLLAIGLFVVAGALLAAGMAATAVFSQLGPLGAAAGALQAPAAGGLGSALLVVPALVLLVVVLILLLVLLWCCCGSAGQLKDVLALLPLVKTAAAGMNAAADALFMMERSLREAQLPVRALGDALTEAGDKVDITVPIVSAQTHHFGLLHADVVTGLNMDSWQPLGDAKTRLHIAGA